MQVPGCGAGAGGLGGPLLDVAQLGDGLGERGQPDDQHQPCPGRVTGHVSARPDEPGRLPEPGPGRARGRDPAVLVFLSDSRVMVRIGGYVL